MENVGTYTDLTDEDLGYARGRALKRAQNRLLITRYGQVDPQPRNATRTRMFTRWNRPAPATAPIAEGISPKGRKLTFSTVQCTLEEYSDTYRFTNRMIQNAKDPWMKQWTAIAGEQAAETIERVDIAVLLSGTNVYYAGAGATSRVTVAGKMTRSDLRVIVRALARQGALPVTQRVSASPLIGTQAVQPAYVSFCHTDLEGDIRDLPGFVSVENYGDANKAEMFEVGKCENIRFFATNLIDPYLAAATSTSSADFLVNGAIPTAAGNPDVYPVIVCGQEAYATVPLASSKENPTEAIKITVQNPKPQLGDEAGLQGFMNWLADHTAIILNQGWMMRYEVLCTAKPG